MRRHGLIGLGFLLVLVALAPDGGTAKDRGVGGKYEVPYRLTQTNHYLVRVRINGKGPFNFLVDTGAPALYVGTEVAKKIGLEPSKTSFWTDVERVDIEGGATLLHQKARVEDPFQLTSMNALGLPGASIDGILGFTVLACFRMEFDPTRDRMVWTRLDYEPKMPPARSGDRAPPEIEAMNLLAPLAKMLAMFTGKQPEEQLHARGFIGITLAERDGMLRVEGVLEKSPAAEGGIKVGDILVTINSRDVRTMKEAIAAVERLQPDDRLAVSVRRGPGAVDLKLRVGQGF